MGLEKLKESIRLEFPGEEGDAICSFKTPTEIADALVIKASVWMTRETVIQELKSGRPENVLAAAEKGERIMKLSWEIRRLRH